MIICAASKMVNGLMSHLGCKRELLSEKYFTYLQSPPMWQNVLGSSGYKEIWNPGEPEKLNNLFEVVRSAARGKNSEARKKLSQQAFNVVVTNNITIVPTMKRSVCTKVEEAYPRDFSEEDVLDTGLCP